MNTSFSNKTKFFSPLTLATASCVLMCSVSISASADDFSQRVYLNAGLGATMIEPESPTSALSISDNSDAGGHLAVGLDLNRFLSIEAYAATLGTAEVDFLGTAAGTVDYTVFGLSAVGYLLNSRSGLVMGDDDPEGLFRREGASLYGRVGVGHMRNKAERVSYQRDYPNHAAFGLGVEYGFDNGFALRTELMGFDTDARYLNIGLLKRFGSVPVEQIAPVEPKAPVAVAKLPEVQEKPVMAVQEPEQKVFRPIQTPFIYFAFDKSDLSQQSTAQLDTLAEQLVDNDLQLRVEGHTDWIAPEAYNISLSVRRAEAVANYLVSRGIARNRISTVGYGETRPISNNNTVEGRTLNRRSEIQLLRPQS